MSAALISGDGGGPRGRAACGRRGRDALRRGVLHGNTACTHTVRLADLNCSAEAYCQARARLPLAVYERLLKQTSQAARFRTSLPLWHGHRTFLVDGSSFSMPDTPALQEHFGQSGAQQSGCGFPAAHWLSMFDARSGLLVKQVAAPLRTHDMSRTWIGRALYGFHRVGRFDGLRRERGRSIRRLACRLQSELRPLGRPGGRRSGFAWRAAFAVRIGREPLPGSRVGTRVPVQRRERCADPKGGAVRRVLPLRLRARRAG